MKPESTSQDIDLKGEFTPECLFQKSNALSCERVNEVTFKITDGEMTRVPASHGQWGGYTTTKARAWVIRIGGGLWLARCGDRACGPSQFSEAKADALAMARGADYWVSGEPISHLNGLQARHLDADASGFAICNQPARMPLVIDSFGLTAGPAWAVKRVHNHSVVVPRIGLVVAPTNRALGYRN